MHTEALEAPVARPRWGTLSVRSHLDLTGLAMDLLLYDALIFPAPADDGEADRWDGEGWDVEALALRITQLGDLAFVVPWDAHLRNEWQALYRYLRKQGDDSESLAFDTTAAMMAEQPLRTIVAPEDDRIRDVLHRPELLAVYEDRNVRRYAGDTMAELVVNHESVRGMGRTHQVAPVTNDRADTAAPEAERDLGLRLDVQLAGPAGDDDEREFHAVRELVEDEDFRRARRRLWGLEQQVDADPDDAVLFVEQLVADYNRAVVATLRRARLRRVVYLVPLVLGAAVGLQVPGPAGVGAGVAIQVGVDHVKARFPRLDERGEHLSHHPGSAVTRAVSVLGHD